MIMALSCTPVKKELPANIKDKDTFNPNGITEEMLRTLSEKGDHIDYLFSGTGVSMNQDGNAAIRQDLTAISITPVASIPTNCAPVARKIYFHRGEILIESDLYFSENCLFQIFIRDEVKLYGNLLSQQGLTFYNNVMSQIRQNIPANNNPSSTN
jgi:hypothetical protein